MASEEQEPGFAELQTALDLRQNGRSAEAKALCAELIARRGDFFDAHYLLGVLSAEELDMAAAADFFGRAAQINPQFLKAHFNHGVALNALGRHEEAIGAYDQALSLDPNHSGSLHNRISSLINLRRLAEALGACEHALTTKETFKLRYNLGVVLSKLDRDQEALQHYDRAIELEPAHAAVHHGRGRTLNKLKRYDDALRSFDRALDIEPNFAEAQVMRGVSLFYMDRNDEAIESYDRAIALRPDHAGAHFNKGMLLLLLGRFEEGWREYEWRKRLPEPLGSRISTQPVWDGETDIRGRTLLIYAEQGRGDAIQSIRYAKLAQESGANVIVAAPHALIRLLGALSPRIEFVDERTEPPSFEFLCAMLSLPLAFKTTLDSIPAGIPYLHADESRVQEWRRRIGGRGFKIGVAWQGARGEIDIGRSFTLPELRPISQLPGVRLISLQKNDGVEQLASLPDDMKVETLGDDFDAGPDAFRDCAAAMMTLDLIITPDTSIAHLAGALGRPAWVALKRLPDWRWLLGCDDSPWYPTLRLFRQQAQGDWTGVFAEMRRALTERLGINDDG